MGVLVLSAENSKEPQRMNIIYLIIIIAGVSGQNIAKKFYTEKAGTSGT